MCDICGTKYCGRFAIRLARSQGEAGIMFYEITMPIDSVIISGVPLNLDCIGP